MKVYIVYSWFAYDGNDTIAAYVSERKAREKVAELREKSKPSSYNGYDYEELEVDETP